MIEVIVDLPAIFLIFVILGLLHPEEHSFGRALELEDINSSVVDLIDLLVLDVVREDDEVVLDVARAAVLPLEMHQLILRLLNLDHSLPFVRTHKTRRAVQRHFPGAKLNQSLG